MAYGEYEPVNDADGLPRILGKGSYGKVFLVRKAKLGRQYALKLLTTELLEKKATARERFLTEVATFASLHHPNIVTIADYGECQEGIYYVMEFCEGGSLETHVRQRRQLPVLLTLRLLEKTASALEYALGKNLIHRDIKPENLMLLSPAERDDDLPDRLRVIDFGLAKQIAASESAGGLPGETQLPSESQIVGTPLYMAPEQLRGMEADHRADIFSIGITAWYLLAGNSAFAHLAHSGQIRQDRFSAIPYSSKLPDHLTGEARALIARMIEKDPARRFQTYAALRQALQEAIAVETAAAAPRPVEAVAAPAAIPETAPGAPTGDAWHYTQLQPAGRDPATGGNLFEAHCQGRSVLLLRLPSNQSAPLSRLVGRLDVPERPAAVVAYHRASFSPLHPQFPGECVCTTEAGSGPDLLSVIRARRRTTLEEGKSLLLQIAEAMDFARTREISLLTAPGEILLTGLGSPDAETPEVAAAPVRIYPTILETPPTEDTATLGATMEAGAAGGGGGRVPGLRDFAALMYHLLAGREVDPAAFVSVRNYRGISSLQTKTDALIRDTIAHLRHPSSCRSLLMSVCSSEGVRLPARASGPGGTLTLEGSLSLSRSMDRSIDRSAAVAATATDPAAPPPLPVPVPVASAGPLSTATEEDPLLQPPALWEELPAATRRRLQSCLRDLWVLRRDIGQYHVTAHSFSTQIRSQSQTFSRHSSLILKEVEEAARDIEACRRTLHDCESRATEAIHQVRDTVQAEEAEIRKKDIFSLLEIAEHAHGDANAHYQLLLSIPERQERLLEELNRCQQEATELLETMGGSWPELPEALTDPAIRQSYASVSRKWEEIRQAATTACQLQTARSLDSLHALEKLAQTTTAALAQAQNAEARIRGEAAAIRQSIAQFEAGQAERFAALATARREVGQAMEQVEEWIHQTSSLARRAREIAASHPGAAPSAGRTDSLLSHLQLLRTDIAEAMEQIAGGPSAEAAGHASQRARQAQLKAATTAKEAAGLVDAMERTLRPAGERLTQAREESSQHAARAGAALRKALAQWEITESALNGILPGDRNSAAVAELQSGIETARAAATAAEQAHRSALEATVPEEVEGFAAASHSAADRAVAAATAVSASASALEETAARWRAGWNQGQAKFQAAVAVCRQLLQQAESLRPSPTGGPPPMPEVAAAWAAITRMESRVQALETAFGSAASLQEIQPLVQEAEQLAESARTDFTPHFAVLQQARQQSEAAAGHHHAAQRAEAERLANEAFEAARKAGSLATRIDHVPGGASRPAALVHVSEAQAAAARAKALLNVPVSHAVLQEMEACSRMAEAAAATLNSLATPVAAPPRRSSPWIPLMLTAVVALAGGGVVWWLLRAGPESGPVKPGNPGNPPPAVVQSPRQPTPPAPPPASGPVPAPKTADVPNTAPGTDPPRPDSPMAAPPAGQPWLVPAHFPTIAAAIAAAGPGQPILLQEGTFSEPLILKSGLRLQAEAGKTVTILTEGLTYSSVDGREAQDVQIEGLTFAHAPGQTSSAGRPVANLSDCAVLFRNCTFRDAVSDGLLVGGTASDLRMQNCILENNSGNGLHITLGARAELDKCIIRTNNRHGIVVDLNQSTLLLNDSQLLSNGDSGAEVGDGAELRAVRVVAQKNHAAGWFVHDAGSRAVLEDCDALENENGLDLRKSATAEIKQSRLLHNTQCGILATNAHWLELTDSTLDGNVLLGVSLLSDALGHSGKARLENNTIARSGQGIRVQGNASAAASSLHAEILRNRIGPHGHYDIWFSSRASGLVQDNRFQSKTGLDVDEGCTVETKGNVHSADP